MNSTIDATTAVQPYVSPSFSLVEHDLVEHEWAQVVGFAAFAAALAFAAYCRHTGGWPVVAKRGWLFVVSCYR